MFFCIDTAIIGTKITMADITKAKDVNTIANTISPIKNKKTEQIIITTMHTINHATLDLVLKILNLTALRCTSAVNVVVPVISII